MARVEFNVKYTLIGPDGTTAVFNDPNDPNYVGVLTEVTGLDSPDVRESADDLVEMDGGVHGDFFYGRRPIVLNGIMLNPSSATARNVRMDILSRASDAMRGDAVLTWQPSGSVPQYVRVRRQQPLRITGGWQKQFQLPLVAADPRIYSFDLNTSTVFTSDILAINLVPNPSFEVDLTGWGLTNSAGVVPGTYARTSTWFDSGGFSCRISGSNGADTTARRIGILTSTGLNGFPVIGGLDYTLATKVNVNSGVAGGGGQNGLRLRLYWYTSSGASATVQNSTSALVPASATGVYDLSYTIAAPADAAFAAVEICCVVDTVSDFVDFYVDDVIVSPGATLPYGYFDGNDARGARWTGTPNQSASELLPPTAGRTYAKDYNMAYGAAAPLGQLFVTNNGTATTYPVMRIYGPGNNPKIYNFTSGKTVSLVYSLGAGDWLTVDALNRTVLLNDSTSRYSAVDFVNTTWWGLAPGVNDLRIAFDTFIAGSALRVDWRDAWI